MPNALTWPGPLAEMTPERRNFTLALGASLLVHAVVLSIHFQLPDILDRAKEHALDVILVNSKSHQKPRDVQAKAQANLDGGGNTDENRRAATPLPPSAKQREGDNLLEAQQRVTQLEAQTRQMMTQLRGDKAVAPDRTRNEQTPVAQPNSSGPDIVSKSLEMVRLLGQIDKETEEYNKRPRKKNIGARVEEYRFAQYVEDWRQKVERIGNLNYPEAAKGRLYGSLLLSVIIRADGTIKQITIDRPSHHKVLDDAARRVVDMAAPYAVFPEVIRKDTDEIEITRTWTFTTSDQLKAD
jgi:protein TonB